MECEHINLCHYMLCLNKVMPITAITVKAKYCDNSKYGCAKYQDHEIIAIDKEGGNLIPSFVMDELELFEKKYNDSYIKLCVRKRKEVKENTKFEFN